MFFSMSISQGCKDSHPYHILTSDLKTRDGTLALLSGLLGVAFHASRASAPKGDKVVQNTGGICMSVHPLLKARLGFLGALLARLKAEKVPLKGLPGALSGLL